MAERTVTEGRSSESDFQKDLSLYTIIIHKCCSLVETYLSMTKDTVLAKLGQHVSATIPLTRISIFQVLGSVLFYNTHTELDEQEKRGFMYQFFYQWNKDCEKMERWLPRKLTVLRLTSILLRPTSALPASILLATTQLISLMVTMPHKTKE